MTAVFQAIDRRAIPQSAQESHWNAPGDWPIRRIDWPARARQGAGGSDRAIRGSILFLPGRGDYYEKYLETLDYYANAGWNVTAVDWRGQGMSGRFLADQNIGHIDDFATWIADIAFFYPQWAAENPGPHAVIGHSMGGHLALRAAAEGAIYPDALILSAPMLDMQTSGLHSSISRAVARFMIFIGRGHAPAWKNSEKPLASFDMRANMLTHDEDRYADEIAWWKIRPGVKLGPASWHWVERAAASIQLMAQPGKLENMHIPTLLMATMADQLVSTKRIMKDATRLPHAQLLLFGDEAAHELLREVDAVRGRCLQVMDAFLNSNAPEFVHAV